MVYWFTQQYSELQPPGGCGGAVTINDIECGLSGCIGCGGYGGSGIINCASAGVIVITTNASTASPIALILVGYVVVGA